MTPWPDTLLPRTRISKLSERTLGLRLAAVCALALVFFFTGCGKKEKPLTPAQIHAITRELQAAVPRDPSQYGRVWATTRKTAANDGATDHLYVTVLPGGSTETTQYTYGVTGSVINSNELLASVTYPATGQANTETYSYDALGEMQRH